MSSAEDSDSSDEDYIPGSKPEEVVSEVESDGDPEDDLSDTEVKAGGKRTKTAKKSRKKPLIHKEAESLDKPKDKGQSEDEKKKLDDDLWADFMKDTGFQSKSTKLDDSKTSNKSTPLPRSYKKTEESISKPTESVKVTETYTFAGEKISIEKEVVKRPNDVGLDKTSSSKPISKRGGGGLGGILSQLGKPPKITTLEKSKLDWDQFKKEKNLDEELRTFNKGKDG